MTRNASTELGLTLGDLRRAVAAYVRQGLARTDATPELDAHLLVARAAGVDATDLPLQAEREVTADVEAEAFAFADRRIAGEPVARIVGHKEFYGLDFALSPETLVPRPDTETVVDAALAFIERRGWRQAPIRIVDLGTGSGAILLALLSQLPSATGIGIDISIGALVTARKNAERFGLADRASFARGDWAAPLRASADVIVANPPYIESGAIVGLARDVREHDPVLALDGGSDGLDAIRNVLAEFGRVLADDGAAFVEIGFGQAESVTDFAAESGFGATFAKDLAGVERVAILMRPPTFTAR